MFGRVPLRIVPTILLLPVRTGSQPPDAAGSGSLVVDEELKAYAYPRHEFIIWRCLVAGRSGVISMMGSQWSQFLRKVA